MSRCAILVMPDVFFYLPITPMIYSYNLYLEVVYNIIIYCLFKPYVYNGEAFNLGLHCALRSVIILNINTLASTKKLQTCILRFSVSSTFSISAINKTAVVSPAVNLIGLSETLAGSRTTANAFLILLITGQTVGCINFNALCRTRWTEESC